MAKLKHAVVVVILANLISACGDGVTADSTTSTDASIWNGQPEEGFLAAGALTATIDGQYRGYVCSGTLISDRVVLTAAHCIIGKGYGDLLASEDSFLGFAVGVDARIAADDSGPVDATIYQVDAIEVYEEFETTGWSGHDLALLRLSAPVLDITPARVLLNDEEPSALLSVGFGSTDDRRWGTRRSVQQDVEGWYPDVVRLKSDGAGLCFGDSGGGTFRLSDKDAQPVLVGVNQAIQGQCGEGYGIIARIRPKMTWIAYVLTNWFAGEDQSPAICGDASPDFDTCQCSQACMDGGFYCDNALCAERYGPLEILQRLDQCGWDDGLCQADAFFRADPYANYGVRSLLSCLQDDESSSAEGSPTYDCSSEYEYLHTMIEVGDSESATCSDGVACQFDEQQCQGSYSCMVGCTAGVTHGRSEFAAFADCAETNCYELYGDQRRECVNQYCSEELNTCQQI